MIESLPFRASAIVLVVANLVPLFGVLYLDWQVFDVVLLYWVENVVIGAINILRMLAARSKRGLFSIVFFAVHYGFFCFAHLMAITGLFDSADDIAVIWQMYFAMPLEQAIRSPIWIGIGAIAVSHLFSFFANFIGAGEYRRTSARHLMSRPYGRIVILHVAILLGAVIIELLGSPVGLLVALVGVKIVFDLRLHLAERDVFAAQDSVLSQSPQP